MRREAQKAVSSLPSLLARPFLALILISACAAVSLIWIRDPILQRTSIVAGVCLTFWLTEVVPPYVPTFVLWALTPLLLVGFGDQFQFTRVLGWSANPVLALFLGGFALSVAASRYGIDRQLNANLKVLTTDKLVDTTGGGVVWHRLHSEREDICEALLKECALGNEPPSAEPTSNEGAMNAANWHRELLQARLRKVDDALDRLMSGSYGECCKCGKWIEDTKLDFDPAIAYCLGCWDRMQTKH